MRRRIPPALGACALALCSLGGAARASDTAPEYYELGQEVVLRVVGRPTFYATSPKGGIDAVDATDGKLIWHSGLASAPLLVHGGKLVAMGPRAPGGGLRLLLLDEATGAAKGELPQLPVEAVIGETLTYRGSIGARTVDGRDVIIWSSLRLPPGVRVSAKQKEVVGVAAEGALAVDLEARTLTPTDAPPRRGPRIRYTGHEDHQFEMTPFDVDGLHVELVPRRGAVFLLRSRDGKPLPDVQIGDRWSMGSPLFESVDRRHVAQIEREALPEAATFVRYNATVTAVATGEKVGAPYKTLDPPSGFVVLGDRLLYRSIPRSRGHDPIPDRIGVQDLKNAFDPVFARAIRSLRYEGRRVLVDPKSPEGAK